MIWALVLLPLFELGLRSWVRSGGRVGYEVYDPGYDAPSLLPGRHETQFGIIEIDEEGFTAREPRESFPQTVRPRRPFRIVALGDSCTFGAGDARTTYPVVLEKNLNGRSGVAYDFHVVNAGIAGLQSDEAIGRLAYSVDVVDPDVVTIYLGWNDLTKASPRSQTKDAWMSRFSREVDHLWLIRGLRKVIFFHLRERLVSPRVGVDGRTGRFAGFRPTYFEENLHHLIAETRRSGALSILVTMPHSLRPELSLDELNHPPRQFPYFRGGDALGDFIELIDRYNESIRRVGAAEGVPVADVAKRFDRIVGKEAYFLDTMHPNESGNRLIAGALEQVLLKEVRLDFASSRTGPRAQTR